MKGTGLICLNALNDISCITREPCLRNLTCVPGVCIEMAFWDLPNGEDGFGQEILKDMIVPGWDNIYLLGM